MWKCPVAGASKLDDAPMLPLPRHSMWRCVREKVASWTAQARSTSRVEEAPLAATSAVINTPNCSSASAARSGLREHDKSALNARCTSCPCGTCGMTCARQHESAMLLHETNIDKLFKLYPPSPPILSLCSPLRSRILTSSVLLAEHTCHHSC